MRCDPGQGEAFLDLTLKGDPQEEKRWIDLSKAKALLCETPVKRTGEKLRELRQQSFLVQNQYSKIASNELSERETQKTPHFHSDRKNEIPRNRFKQGSEASVH